MNDQGVFAACLEEHPALPVPPTASTQFVHELHGSIVTATSAQDMEHAARTRPLAQIPGVGLHVLVADRNGNSAILEATKKDAFIQSHKQTAAVMTNFPIRTLERATIDTFDGIGADRYRTACRFLENRPSGITANQAMNLLSRVTNRDPKYPTACSMVFLPDTLEIRLVAHRNFDTVHRILLKEGTLIKADGTSLPIPEGGIRIRDL